MLLISAKILTVLLVFVCLLLILVILMQRPKQEGLGAAFGGALTDRVLGSGTTDFLQKSTVFLSVLFFVFSLTIASLLAWDRAGERSLNLDKLKDKTEEAKPIEAPAAPAENKPAEGAAPAQPVVVPPAEGAAPAGNPPAQPETPPAQPETPPAQPETPPAQPPTPPAQPATPPAEPATPPAAPEPPPAGNP